MSKIVLLGDRATPFSEKVVRALELKSISYELRVPRSRAEIREWNPVTRQIPVLQLDGERVHDSGKILEVLDERCPDPPLLAADPKLAASQRQLHDWADSMLMYYWTSWLRAVEHADAVSSEPRRGAGWLRRRGEDREASGVPRRVPGAVVAELGKRLDDMVGFLGDRPFFFADQPSMADLAVYAGLHSMRLGGLTGGPELVEARPPLSAFMKRIEERTGGPLPEDSIPPGARSPWLETA